MLVGKRLVNKFLTICGVVGLSFLAVADFALAQTGDYESGDLVNEHQSSESVADFGILWFDSGWDFVGISPDPFPIVYTHNVGGNPDDYFVYLECLDFSELGSYDCTNHAFNINAHWFGLTSSSIKVWVTGSGMPDYIRVRIFSKPTIYNSGWHALNARPDPVSVSFALGRKFNLDNLVVHLDCRDDSELGTYDCTNQNFYNDAHWYNLGLSDIKVYVEKGSRPDAVRVRFLSEAPAYNSDWQVIGSRPDDIVMPFFHSLGGDVNQYFLKMDCRDDTVLGTYDCTNQLFNRGVHWYGLANSDVNLYVTGGSVPDEVRVRIWQQDLSIPEKTFLPLVINLASCEP